MKRFFSLALVIIIAALALTACSSDDNDDNDSSANSTTETASQVTETETETESSTEPENFKTETDGVRVTRAIPIAKYNSYTQTYGDYKSLVIAVENTRDDTVDVTAKVKFYKGDELVGTEEGLIRDLQGALLDDGTKASSLAQDVTNVSCGEDFTNFTIDFKVKKSDTKKIKALSHNIDYRYEMTENRVLVEVTNNGKETADHIDGTVLFYTQGTLTGISSIPLYSKEIYKYAGDEYPDSYDYSFAPGVSATQEVRNYNAFDSVEIYISAFRYIH